mgnify:CR=1 FL=1
MKRSKREPQKIVPILRELGFRIKEVYADCIDLMVDVPAISEAELSTRTMGETSTAVRGRVMAARDRFQPCSSQ